MKFRMHHYLLQQLALDMLFCYRKPYTIPILEVLLRANAISGQGSLFKDRRPILIPKKAHWMQDVFRSTAV